MITPGDEYPLHQTPRPVRHAGVGRNFYDRFFFNGCSSDGSAFFAIALGVYPGRDVMDAAIGVVVDGVQHNVRASRRLGADRLATRVGPIEVSIDRPLEQLTITVDDEIGASLVFSAASAPVEEEPYLWEHDNRVLFDFTRLTQPASWSGWIDVPGGARLDVSGWRGARDRSWGYRPVGERDQGAPPSFPGFYWLWAPCTFDDGFGLYALNEHPDGRRWHEDGFWNGERVSPAGIDVHWRSGTRHAEAATLRLGPHTVELTPTLQFFMQGIGYTNPTWGHGMFLGEEVRVYEALTLAEVDENALMNQHIQAVCTLRRDDGAVGTGVLEQLVLGPHAPSGLADWFDTHP